MGRIIVQHLRTNVSGKKPSPDDIMNGELAINYAASGETLYIKNSDEEIIEFKDNKYYQKQLSDKVDKVTGKQLSTEDFTSALKTKLEGLNNYDDAAIQEAVSGLQTQINTLVSGDASTAIESFNEIIAFLDGVEDTETLDGIIASIEQQIASKYTKPSGGIPKTDLESAVQTSLGKADTALQEHQSLDGYVKDTDLATVAKSGSYNDLTNKPIIPDALADLTDDASHRTVTDTEKSTWNAKSNFSGSYNDLSDKPTIPDISGKQDKLVSGTNIKTINGESILGSGNIEIEGGGSIPVVEISGTSVALTANQFIILTNGQTSTLTVTLNAVEDSSIYNEYMLQFSTGTPAPTVNFPSSVVWVETPVIEASRTYQVSIVDNKGIICSWERISLISFTIDGVTYFATQGMTWGKWVESDYNTGGFYKSDNRIAFNSYLFVDTNGDGYVNTSYIIQENYEYTIG